MTCIWKFVTNCHCSVYYCSMVTAAVWPERICRGRWCPGRRRPGAAAPWAASGWWGRSHRARWTPAWSSTGSCPCGPGARAVNRLIGEVAQSRRRPLLGPFPGWKRLLPLVKSSLNIVHYPGPRLLRAIIRSPDNLKIFFAGIPQGPLETSPGTIGIIQKRFQGPPTRGFWNF